jgi:hypothetical protein
MRRIIAIIISLMTLVACDSTVLQQVKADSNTLTRSKAEAVINKHLAVPRDSGFGELTENGTKLLFGPEDVAMGDRLGFFRQVGTNWEGTWRRFTAKGLAAFHVPDPNSKFTSSWGFEMYQLQVACRCIHQVDQITGISQGNDNMHVVKFTTKIVPQCNSAELREFVNGLKKRPTEATLVLFDDGWRVKD